MNSAGKILFNRVRMGGVSLQGFVQFKGRTDHWLDINLQVD
jgi:hypothetical protein